MSPPAEQSAAGDGALRRATLELGARPLATRHGEFALHFFRDLASGRLAMVLARGDLAAREALLARVHSACVTSECLMGRDCDCAEQLDAALARIAEADRGLVVYLMQEGRGAGLSAKARDRMLVQASGNRLSTFDAYAEMGLPPDLRRYDAVGSILALLGVRGPLRLLTNNPEKRLAVARALADEKLEIEGTLPIRGRETRFNRDYLRAKRAMGHALARSSPEAGGAGSGGATGLSGTPPPPPPPAKAFAPVALASDPGRLVTAAYWLPIALDESIEWFLSSVLVERESGRESIVLTRHAPSSPAQTPLPAAGDAVAFSLLDRFPLASPRGRIELERALRRLREGASVQLGIAWDEVSLPRDDGGAAGSGPVHGSTGETAAGGAPLAGA